MGRNRLPEDERKDKVPLRLPTWLIERIKADGKVQEVIERILTKHYKKEK